MRLRLVIGLTLVVCAPAAADEQVLAVEEAATTVAASDTVVAWSSFDAAAERYALVMHRGGTTVRPAVAPRRIPFDLDAGTYRGREVLTYSRCPIDAPATINLTLPDWAASDGCRPFALDVETGRETLLAVPSGDRRGLTRVLPSASGTRVAFAERRGRGQPVRVVVSDGRKLTRIAGGSRGAGTSDDYPRPAPSGIDLLGRRIGFIWDGVISRRCESRNSKLDSIATEVWVGGVGGRSRRLAFGCDDRPDRGYVGFSVISPDEIFYRPVRDGRGGTFRTVDLRQRRTTVSPAAENVLSAAATPARIAYVHSPAASSGRSRYVVATVSRQPAAASTTRSQVSAPPRTR